MRMGRGNGAWEAPKSSRFTILPVFEQNILLDKLMSAPLLN